MHNHQLEQTQLVIDLSWLNMLLYSTTLSKPMDLKYIVVAAPYILHNLHLR